jgi:hypothetical protein
MPTRGRAIDHGADEYAYDSEVPHAILGSVAA